MAYLTPDNFRKLYPYDEKYIDEGVYAKIYTKDDVNYVIKKITVNHIESEVREINHLTRLQHTNMIKMLNWTFDVNLYIALEKGKSIKREWAKGNISTRKIISDLLTVIKFLHDNLVCHLDVTLSNVVYIDGRAVLIDFGLSKMIEPFKDKLYVSGIGYPVPYRDPEYDFRTSNDASSDIYSLGILIYCLVEGIGQPSSNLRPYTFNVLSFRPGIDESVKNFISDCIKPVSMRPKIEELLDKYGDVSLIKQKIIRPIYKGHEFWDEELMNTIFLHTYRYAKKLKLNVKTLFETFDLIHRVVDYFSFTYSTNIELIKEFSSTCLAMVECLNGDTMELCYITDSILRKVLICSNGIIVHESLWNYATSANHLKYMLKNIFSPTYSISKMPKSPIDYGVSKHITVALFRSFLKRKNLLRIIRELPEVENVNTEEYFIKKSNWIVKLTKNYEENLLYRYDACLIRRIHHIKYMSNDTACKIYNRLMKNDDIKILKWYYYYFSNNKDCSILPREIKIDINPFDVDEIEELTGEKVYKHSERKTMFPF
jgi:serine/threonine protein kinase